jgi:SAM-dependent methyltransferase
MTLQGLRHSLSWLRRTPLHPQWLLDSRQSVERWASPHLTGLILDIGCGDRWLEPLVAGRGHYIGLDSLATGAALYGARPSLFGDAATLPLADASLDCVVLLEVLEHLEHPRRALGEIARVLKPGGRLLLSMPFLYPIHDAPHDFQRYTTHGLAREISAVGLDVDAITNARHSLEASGLLAAIGCAGVAIEALRQRSLSLLVVPFVLIAVPLINLAAWIAARLLPDWPALTSGYRVIATKPA